MMVTAMVVLEVLYTVEPHTIPDFEQVYNLYICIEQFAFFCVSLFFLYLFLHDFACSNDDGGQSYYV